MNKLNILLLIVTLLTGLGVVTVEDQSRQYYIELDRAEKHEVELDQDYARLKLEQAKLANHQLIKAAAKQQNLHPPGNTDTKMIDLK